MGSQNILFLSITIAVCVYLLSPLVYPVTAQSKFVTDFCNQRKTTEDRAFCLKVFKPQPLSVTANDNPTILKIVLHMALAHASKTREFMSGLEQNNSTNAAFKPVLKQCISAYEDGINDLENIGSVLEDNPPMASYDAQMAKDELSRCDNAMKTSNISNEAVSIMHKIELDYTKLCLEIAEIM